MTVGAKLTGAGLVQTQTGGVDGGVITNINTSNGQVTVTTNQTLADNTKIFVQGATMRVSVIGSYTITRFPKFSTDVFFDLDRACVLSTTS
jgi:prephenate dehydratase